VTPSAAETRTSTATRTQNPRNRRPLPDSNCEPHTSLIKFFKNP
jgi:hypothetical protein